MTEPTRSRAVFSSEDFRLLKVALIHYLQTAGESPDQVKLSNLYHRLGRVG